MDGTKYKPVKEVVETFERQGPLDIMELLNSSHLTLMFNNSINQYKFYYAEGANAVFLG